MFFTCITWACESWELRIADKNTLNTWWNRQLRRCLGVTKEDHILTDTIYKKLGTMALSEMVRLRKLRYLGHVVRYPHARWVRKSLTFAYDSAQSAGRKLTWVKDINQILHDIPIKLSDCLDKDLWNKVSSGRKIVVVNPLSRTRRRVTFDDVLIDSGGSSRP